MHPFLLLASAAAAFTTTYLIFRKGEKVGESEEKVQTLQKSKKASKKEKEALSAVARLHPADVDNIVERVRYREEQPDKQPHIDKHTVLKGEEKLPKGDGGGGGKTDKLPQKENTPAGSSND